MIDFPCKCGHRFSLPQDQAGGLIQCPDCGLLADVPTLSDLANLNDDGTFAFEESPPTDTLTAADLHRVFTTKTTNSQGVEKDLRPKGDYFKVIGSQELIPAKPAPRYDPATGELIRPLELKDETPMPVLSLGAVVDPSEIDADDEQPMPVSPVRPAPVVAAPSLGYAMGDARKQVTLKTLGVELLMPANTIVMAFIFVLFLVATAVTSTIATYAERFIAVVWPLLAVNIPMWMILAHLGCTIEDIGPDAVDELPRPLRNFSLGEDLIGPLLRVLLAGAICFWPAVLAWRALDLENPHTMPALLLFALAGAYPFPAVLLSAVTGSTVLNLRPDRVMTVIKLSGGNYLLSVALFICAAVPAFYYLAGELIFRQQLNGPFFQQIDKPRVGLPVIMVTVYLLHFFCWHLGLLYRANHNQFPWVGQYHVKRNAAYTSGPRIS